MLRGGGVSHTGREGERLCLNHRLYCITTSSAGNGGDKCSGTNTMPYENIFKFGICQAVPLVKGIRCDLIHLDCLIVIPRTFILMSHH